MDDSRLALRSRLGAMTLVLLCAVQFLDIADSAIVNVALPSIQHSLDFSQQNLQWVASGYILTYGGFLLLGGRLADLLGRRRMLLAGARRLRASSSLTAGWPTARGCSSRPGSCRAPALRSWLRRRFRSSRPASARARTATRRSGSGARSAGWRPPRASSSAGCCRGPGWRWVFFVNPPICVLVAVGAFVLLASDRGAESRDAPVSTRRGPCW